MDDYPIVPHEEATGADCCGFIVARVQGETANLVCNECGAIIDTVPADTIDVVMKALASDAICSARCPRCGEVNAFPGFSSIDAFVCAQCGEGVEVSSSAQ